jgi:hypothetical protein
VSFNRTHEQSLSSSQKTQKFYQQSNKQNSVAALQWEVREKIMSLEILPRLNAQRLVAHEQELELSPEKFGFLRDSNDIVDNDAALRERMETEGYIFLPGYLDREEVLAARLEMLTRLAREGHLDENFPIEDAIASPQTTVKFHPDLAKGNAPLMRVLYSGAMIEFYEKLLGEEVRHFDFTWVRAVSPGTGTAPHCDHVYMGRGTDKLFTSWTPLGDVSLELGGLMVLEGSHHHDRLRENYCRKDVDAFCSNRRGDDYTEMGGGGNIRAGGWLSNKPKNLRERLGGRWLTSEYRAGDLLTFSTFLVHAGLDNQTNQIRLSSDSRYQAASQPADERWIGANPIGHGPNAKRAMIC